MNKLLSYMFLGMLINIAFYFLIDIGKKQSQSKYYSGNSNGNRNYFY